MVKWIEEYAARISLTGFSHGFVIFCEMIIVCNWSILSKVSDLTPSLTGSHTCCVSVPLAFRSIWYFVRAHFNGTSNIRT